MSELQAYYDAFRTGYWAHPDEGRCPCHGGGWVCSEVDTWHQCPIHYTSQPHPEDYSYEGEPVACEPPAQVVPPPSEDTDECPF